MGMRAVTTVIDQTGVPRRFWSAWASPEYQIPYLANFLTWADQHHQPLTIDTYLRYGAHHPGALPVQDVTDAFADEDLASDLDYRYHLTLDTDTRDVTLTVRDMRRRRADRVVETITRASLYDAAARRCELVATRCQQWADTNNGHHLPGGDLAQWRAAAADFRNQQATTPVAFPVHTPATAQTTPADTGPGRTRRARPAAPEHEHAAEAGAGYHDVVTERSVVALGMSRGQFHGLAPALGLPPTWFGRFKGCPGERRDIHLNSGASSCLTEAGLDTAIGYLRAHRLAYEQTTTIRHEPAPMPADHPDPEGTSR
jgi:hypothetical protein